MSTIIVALFVFVLLTAGAVGILLLAFMKSRSARKADMAKLAVVSPESSRNISLSFRFVDVLVPTVVLIVSVVSAIFFYRLMPAQVAYHFASDGLPDRWISRGLLAIALILPQFLLAFLAAGIAFVMVKVGGKFVREGETPVSVVRGVSGLMSNMIALPQLVLFFAMLDISIYNAYQVHLPPLYIFAILMMLVGGLVMGIFFFRVIQRARTDK